MKEAIWLRGLLEELDIPVGNMIMHCDSSGCISNLKNPLNSKYTKHLAIPLHYAREAVSVGQVDVQKINTELNTADVLTKPMVPVLFKRHCLGLGVRAVV